MSALRKAFSVFVMIGVISIYSATSYADSDRRGDRNGHQWEGRRDGHGNHNNGHRYGRPAHRDWDHDHSFWNVNFRFTPAPRRYVYERTVFVSPPVVTYYTPPVTIVQPPPAPVLTAPIAADNMSEFTVNIPNNNGSYTAVVIKRSESGFVGPQGEFYPEFPAVAQLRVIYGM